MSAGPLRRTMAVVGLLALVPIAWLLVTGALSPEVAALRSAVVLVVVLVLGNVARLVLTGLVRTVEAPDGDTAARDGELAWDGTDRRSRPSGASEVGRPV